MFLLSGMREMICLQQFHNIFTTNPKWCKNCFERVRERERDLAHLGNFLGIMGWGQSYRNGRTG